MPKEDVHTLVTAPASCRMVSLEAQKLQYRAVDRVGYVQRAALDLLCILISVP